MMELDNDVEDLLKEVPREEAVKLVNDILRIYLPGTLNAKKFNKKVKSPGSRTWGL